MCTEFYTTGIRQWGKKWGWGYLMTSEANKDIKLDSIKGILFLKELVYCLRIIYRGPSDFFFNISFVRFFFFFFFLTYLFIGELFLLLSNSLSLHFLIFLKTTYQSSVNVFIICSDTWQLNFFTEKWAKYVKQKCWFF